ncbi:MAG TPA: DNA polymerase III subunit [Candidatus Limnocylindrales bacterium]|nr:DNA polymerase III subunit [Candidatus Limnocylindrales bacterium]
MVAESTTTQGRLLTRGHDRARDAVRAMIAGRAPHALLIGGPPGIGKTTLAVDLAAGLLCTDPDPAARPCRACRACRLVDRRIHPDLHLLAPAGPGDQIRIGTRERPEDGSVRRLALDLSLLAMEGGARVAIIERADRLGDDAQTALLKTLEEPPAGVTIILCADDEDRLMPTVRSRCARIRLGPVTTREIEAILADADEAEPALAARLARLSGGRPGLARLLARTPDALASRDVAARTLLDLLQAGPATRLAAARELVAAASSIDRALASAVDSVDTGGSARDSAPAGKGRGGRTTRRGAERLPATPSATESSRTNDASGDAGGAGAVDASAEGSTDDEDGAGSLTTANRTALERRRAVAWLIGLWRELARDLLVVALGADREVRDIALLDDLRVASAGAATAGAVFTAFLGRLDAAGELIEANVRPELVLDTLLLAWPVTRSVAVGQPGRGAEPGRGAA